MEPYSHTLTETARELRHRQTFAEKALWNALRRRGVGGLKFRRQHRIGSYIVDFYCAEKNVVVELEGSVHLQPDQIKYDESRFEELNSRGLQILRTDNEDIVTNLEGVLRKISEACGLP